MQMRDETIRRRKIARRKGKSRCLESLRAGEEDDAQEEEEEEEVVVVCICRQEKIKRKKHGIT